MAFANGNGLGGGRRRGRSHMGAMSDMNVVPLVDVVLVVLVIFMLTAHVMEFGIEVEVPKVRHVKESAQELPIVNVTKDARVYLNDKPVNINQLVGEVEKRFGKEIGRASCRESV